MLQQEADYRLDGRVEIICAAADGEVRGYLPTDVSEGATPESLNSLDEVARGLEEKKQALLIELRNYEEGEWVLMVLMCSWNVAAQSSAMLQD
eukprot:COSAG05_NODE_7558_length_797_cov_0.749284_1_plen_93_part_00